MNISRNDQIIEQMKEIIPHLQDAIKDYYAGADESIMSDHQYDELLNELIDLENESGIKLAGSPTVQVGYQYTDEEGKYEHYKPVLSLKATKSVDEMFRFLGPKEGILSWKLDGVSIVLYYHNGQLYHALSRGDGHTGKDITKNVLQMQSVPKQIRSKGFTVIRGEGCLALDRFEQIKQTKEGERFTNPRNLASGLVNATRTSSVLLHQLTFIAHTAICLDRPFKTRTLQLDYMERIGFQVVPHSRVLNFELKQEIEMYTLATEQFEYPVDGLVLSLNDIRYGESLGETAKWPKHSLAYKWPDETVLTKVRGMKWSVSRTGLITPVVLLEPVWLEGTTVKQANLHSLKIFENFQIGIGDTVKVYKANKIIPEVEENYTRSDTERYPRVCPVCSVRTTVVETEKTKKLYCGGSCGK